MQKKRLCFVIVFLAAVFLHAQEQDERKIAEALVDRLMCAHLSVTFKSHEPITLRIEEKDRRAYMMWKGNKVFAMKTRTLDTETDQLSIGENIVEMTGNGYNRLFLNKAGRSLYVWSSRRNRAVHFARVRIQKRRDHMKVTVLKHQSISLDICLKHKTGVVYFSGKIPFRISFKYKKIRGSDKNNLLQVRGNGSKVFYLNRSRKIIYFKNRSPAMDGIFARVDIKDTIGQTGHSIWKLNAEN